MKQEFIELLSNGHKGRFNQYGIDLFLIGKSRKDFLVRKIREIKIELEIIGEKIRILESSPIKTKIEIDDSFDWSEFVDELKFLLYFVSWLNLGIGKILIWRSINI